WLTRDAAACLAVRNNLPSTERAHFSQYKSARALYDAVVARYSSPTTAALSRLMLPYLFPELAAIAAVADLVAHLRTSDARYCAALPIEDHFLSLCPTELTVDLLEERLAAAEKSILAVGASRGDRRTPFFEGCSPVPLLPSIASTAAVDLVGTEEVGAASAPSRQRFTGKGKESKGGGGGGGGSGGVGGGGGGGGPGGGGVGGGGGGREGGGGGGGGGSSGGGGSRGGGAGRGAATQRGGLGGGQRVPLPSPHASSPPNGPDLESDSLRAASPTVTCFLATAVTDPLFDSSAASALVAELVDFAAACRLDYAASLVAESASASICPPSVGGECALGTDVLEDRHEDLECFAAASPHLVSMLLAPEGDPDALDIPTPRSYAEAIEGPYSSQWQAAMDAKMAS
ncbi:unnamed protein product, partial [Closterium sp. NIES-54]